MPGTVLQPKKGQRIRVSNASGTTDYIVIEAMYGMSHMHQAYLKQVVWRYKGGTTRWTSTAKEWCKMVAKGRLV